MAENSNPDDTQGEGRVSVEFRDHVAHVMLTRADKMNAVDGEMLKAIIAAGKSVAASDARAVVLSGAGKSFCAGLDVMSFAAMGQMRDNDWILQRTEGDSNDFQAVAMIWRNLEIPVIAALQGAVYGAGLQIALGADIRIAAPDARLAIMEMKWGLVPDMGGMALLPRLLRSDVLRQLTYTATPVAAEQAALWGLVTEIHDAPLARAEALALEIASKGPRAIRAAKRLISYAESGASEAEVLLRESAEQAELIGKPEQTEVVMANMQNRRPVFE
ncbi:crotonase/enoyl-CoA hydratase family protein [Phaeobacter sp. B1627]|uniref:crotonase/enoyl-CoA hydratase family protein n=1 Tax=Phaeobacter sp. B1627 TaxID=2583809 RepID=UPI00111A1C27|nr:crotonase/enoyl-CoA hydratase family protein [Phaeobacter sp. B1627]TNJ48567.1 crotonase/enoyl-CoA hydratase family protein [Phaeobacter sp. B1627]